MLGPQDHVIGAGCEELGEEEQAEIPMTEGGKAGDTAVRFS